MARAAYLRARFKRALRAHTRRGFRNDGSDLLIYLIYIDYLDTLLREGRRILESRSSSDIYTEHLQEANEEVMRRYRG